MQGLKFDIRAALSLFISGQADAIADIFSKLPAAQVSAIEGFRGGDLAYDVL
ncbi:MAG TPA: hypothetical protein VFU86_10465 [Terriglobales bacterium]|nr:hypothetical protein [Terriglobales bacterium]